MIPKELEAHVIDALKNNMGVVELKAKFGISNYTVYRIKQKQGFNSNGKVTESEKEKRYIRRGEHSHYVFQNQNRHESFIENCF